MGIIARAHDGTMATIFLCLNIFVNCNTIIIGNSKKRSNCPSTPVPSKRKRVGVEKLLALAANATQRAAACRRYFTIVSIVYALFVGNEFLANMFNLFCVESRACRANYYGIFVAKGRSLPMETIDAAEAVADCGIKGDRYFTQEGTFSKNKNKVATLLSSK